MDKNLSFQDRSRPLKPTTQSHSCSNPALTEVVSNLSQFKLFRRFTPSELSWIKKHCSLQTLQRGEALFHEGKPIRNIYLIVKGHLKFSKKDFNGNERAFSLIGEHEVIELKARRGAEKHSDSAYALDHVIALKIPESDFRDYVMGNAKLANGILYQKVCTIKRLCNNCMVAYQPAEVRLAYLIWEFRERPGMAQKEGKIIRLGFPLTRKELSELANTTTETTIRVVGKWIKKGWVTMDQKKLIIRNISAFKKIIRKLPLLRINRQK